jgi:tetratricopeptide (TPR) repeat protein
VQADARYCPSCGAPIEGGDELTARREQAERLLQEAMRLSEQGREEEALLACEGALALQPDLLPALSLKALLHERRGQIEQAIETYQRVVQLNPLSVTERARLESLRRQPRAAVRPAALSARPLWLDALPGVLALLGAGMVLMVGLVALLRLTAPTTTPAATPPAPAASTPPPPAPSPNATPANPPAPTESPAAPSVPPVLVDPSQLALAPSETVSPPRGSIPATPPTPKTDAPAPSTPSNAQNSANGKEATNRAQSDLMPDVEVREPRQEGVYEIYVHKGEAASEPSRSNANPAPARENPLETARRHQMAGNYRQAIEAYQQALPTAPSQGEVYQQIAICYLRLGDKPNARTHFLRAIEAYQAQIQRGERVDAAREGIRACEQGLKLCE